MNTAQSFTERERPLHQVRYYDQQVCASLVVILHGFSLFVVAVVK